jgi:hypothetical protein
MIQGMPTATLGRQRRKDANELIISYLYLRMTVGWLAILLPFALLVGNIVISGQQPESISGYYYTGMRNVLVGALCVLGVFLIAYSGYDEPDRWITNLAGIGALAVAFFPTSSPSFRPSAIGVFHHIFAATAMTLMGFMALQFMKMKAPAEGTHASWTEIWRLLRTLRHAERVPDHQSRKKIRNKIYRICAWVILASVVLGAAQSFVPLSVKGNSHLLFWFETLALVAFGASWFVKGTDVVRSATSAGTQQKPPDLRRSASREPDHRDVITHRIGAIWNGSMSGVRQVETGGIQRRDSRTHIGIMPVIKDHSPFELGIMPDHACDRGGARLDPGASRSQAYQPDPGVDRPLGCAGWPDTELAKRLCTLSFVPCSPVALAGHWHKRLYPVVSGARRRLRREKGGEARWGLQPSIRFLHSQGKAPVRYARPLCHRWCDAPTSA